MGRLKGAVAVWLLRTAFVVHPTMALEFVRQIVIRDESLRRDIERNVEAWLNTGQFVTHDR